MKADDAMRQRFEEWWRGRGADPVKFTRNIPGTGYMDSPTDTAWIAWQAASSLAATAGDEAGIAAGLADVAAGRTRPLDEIRSGLERDVLMAIVDIFDEELGSDWMSDGSVWECVERKLRDLLHRAKQGGDRWTQIEIDAAKWRAHELDKIGWTGEAKQGGEVERNAAAMSDNVEYESLLLASAWEWYVAFFGEPPHGTQKQLGALLELRPK